MSLNTYPNNPFPPSTEQMHRGDNEELQAQIDAMKNSATIDSFGDVETALATKTDNDVIAPEFDAEAGVYSVGDLVMHEGKLYEFTTAHETAGVWNPEEVTEKTVADEVDTLKSGLTNVKHQFSLDGTTNAYTGDMDDLYDTGCYWCAANTNLPTGQWYVVFVCTPYIDANGGIPAQIAICYTAANAGKTYSRIKTANGWSTWSALN